MSQENVNLLLRRINTKEGAIDALSLQNIKELPDYSQLPPEEKNAFTNADLNSINAFLSSAATRRDNATDSLKSSM